MYLFIFTFYRSDGSFEPRLKANNLLFGGFKLMAAANLLAPQSRSFFGRLLRDSVHGGAITEFRHI